MTNVINRLDVCVNNLINLNKIIVITNRNLRIKSYRSLCDKTKPEETEKVKFKIAPKVNQSFISLDTRGKTVPGGRIKIKFDTTSTPKVEEPKRISFSKEGGDKISKFSILKKLKNENEKTVEETNNVKKVSVIDAIESKVILNQPVVEESKKVKKASVIDAIESKISQPAAPVEDRKKVSKASVIDAIESKVILSRPVVKQTVKESDKVSSPSKPEEKFKKAAIDVSKIMSAKTEEQQIETVENILKPLAQVSKSATISRIAK